MAGYFHGGQVKFDKYKPGWQSLFPKSQADPKVKQITVTSRLKIILGYNQPDLSSARKSKDPALKLLFAHCNVPIPKCIFY